MATEYRTHMPAETVLACVDCGALVLDAQAHDRHHERLDARADDTRWDAAYKAGRRDAAKAVDAAAKAEMERLGGEGRVHNSSLLTNWVYGIYEGARHASGGGER
jgi:hypothetical protein